jgi:hypothetical protein
MLSTIFDIRQALVRRVRRYDPRTTRAAVSRSAGQPGEPARVLRCPCEVTPPPKLKSALLNRAGPGASQPTRWASLSGRPMSSGGIPGQLGVGQGERSDPGEWVPIPEELVDFPRVDEKSQPNDEAVPGRRGGLGLECRQVLHHEAGARRRAVRTILDCSPRPGGKVSAHGRVAGRPGPPLLASCPRACSKAAANPGRARSIMSSVAVREIRK